MTSGSGSPEGYGLLARHGRNEDNSLLGGQVAHISAAEAALLRSMGGAGSINPVTGLPEYIGTGGGAAGGLGGAGGPGGAVGPGSGASGVGAATPFGFSPTTVAQGLSMGFMGPTGISASPTNSGLGFLANAPPNAGPVSNANSSAQSANSANSQFGFNPSNVSSLGEPTGETAGSAMSSIMGETSVPPWVLPQTDLPADVVMSDYFDVPVEFQFEGMKDKGQVTHQNLSNVTPNVPPEVLADQIQKTQEFFEKIADVKADIPLSETIPSEISKPLSLLSNFLVPPNLIAPVVPLAFLGDALAAQLGESGRSNIGSTIGFLGSEGGQASMSPGNPFGGQASGFAALNLDDPFYAMGLADRPDAEMSYRGERPAEEEEVTLESLIAEITQGSPIGLTTPEGAVSGTSSIDTSPLIELIVQVALGNIARQKQNLPQQSQRTYPSDIQQILDEFYNETTA